MARAYLRIDEGLRDCFVGAQEDLSVRWVSARIEGEEVALRATGKRGNSTSEDFDALIETAELAPNEPGFVLFDAGDETRQWLLVAWVPDTAAPRLKMLYSSSREDLKTGLGSGYFTRDYCANATADLTWAQLTHTTEKPLTETEILMNEEKLLEKETSIKASGMASVPFRVSPALLALFEQFETTPCKIEITVENETFDGAVVEDFREDNTPKFLLFPADGDKRFLVYFCPDAASVKQKMVYSTAKATLISLVPFKLQSAEIRSDLQYELTQLAHPAEDKRELNHAPISKPQRPGRASVKRKPKKWTPAPP
ncbi:hypothetical protein CTAYLR_001946 [Chrysophaeum taylorii]|uniref:ADF-H domain-containing protein n=1 Tax=Chrysophaeum taylorii TaxID=2483200 RepID=A0AAD7U992_9STRA|nr:hypothetical protein CTAYLR_001946 [Chrysophaeum taylorii]